MLRVTTKFDKETDRLNDNFTDLSEWHVTDMAIQPHVSLTNDKNFGTSKHEIFCNVGPHKAAEREQFSSIVRKGVAQNRSAIKEIQPTGTLENYEVEKRTHSNGTC